jgi:putative RNA 2'-phosphotransferase
MRDPKGTSKLLSLVLRHNPGKLGLVLDANGYVPVDELLEAFARRGLALDRVELDEIVATNDKQRFAFSEDGAKIRASQGHSLQVDLGYAPAVPPPILYHGTAQRSLVSIQRDGLLKRTRQHVHLSALREMALTVGSRHGGKALVLAVDAGQMHFDEYPFYLSANGVWLVGHVPPEYLRVSP